MEVMTDCLHILKIKNIAIDLNSKMVSRIMVSVKQKDGSIITTRL